MHLQIILKYYNEKATINMVHHTYGEEYDPKCGLRGLEVRKVSCFKNIFEFKIYISNWQ